MLYSFQAPPERRPLRPLRHRARQYSALMTSVLLKASPLKSRGCLEAGEPRSILREWFRIDAEAFQQRVESDLPARTLLGQHDRGRLYVPAGTCLSRSNTELPDYVIARRPPSGGFPRRLVP